MTSNQHQWIIKNDIKIFGLLNDLWSECNDMKLGRDGEVGSGRTVGPVGPEEEWFFPTPNLVSPQQTG